MSLPLTVIRLVANFMKRYWIILIMIATVALLILFFFFDQYSHMTENQVLDVDSQIADMLENPDYRNSSIEGRKLFAEELLRQLKRNRLIKSYAFNEENHLFSFAYAVGTLGGIRIYDFDSLYNGEIAMN